MLIMKSYEIKIKLDSMYNNDQLKNNISFVLRQGGIRFDEIEVNENKK